MGLAGQTHSANHIFKHIFFNDPYIRNIMKNKLILVTLLLFAAVLYSSTSQAQALVITDHEVVFYDKNEVPFPSIQAKSIVSPNGNVTIIASFQLDEGNELVPEKGIITILAVLEREDADNEYNSVFCVVNIPPSGRFTIKYHMNGAGYVFPQVWEPYLKSILEREQ